MFCRARKPIVSKKYFKKSNAGSFYGVIDDQNDP